MGASLAGSIGQEQAVYSSKRWIRGAQRDKSQDLVDSRMAVTFRTFSGRGAMGPDSHSAELSEGY